jgi:hypothetical protein
MLTNGPLQIRPKIWTSVLERPTDFPQARSTYAEVNEKPPYWIILMRARDTQIFDHNIRDDKWVFYHNLNNSIEDSRFLS